MSEEKQAVTSSLEQRARLIAVKNANDDLSNDFIGTEGVAENALTGASQHMVSKSFPLFESSTQTDHRSIDGMLY